MGYFQIFSSFRGAKGANDQKGAQGGQKTHMKIEIHLILMEFKTYILNNT